MGTIATYSTGWIQVSSNVATFLGLADPPHPKAAVQVPLMGEWWFFREFSGGFEAEAAALSLLNKRLFY